MEVLSCSRVKELQAMLFPIRPISGGTLTCLQGLQELNIQQLEGSSVPRRFALPLTATSQERAREALRALLDARCLVDGISQEAARWPTECQVIPERVQHKDYSPSAPEPFYVPTGKEPRPKPIGDEFGTVVFRYCPTNVTNYFSRSCVGGSAALPCSIEQSPERTMHHAENNDVLLLTESSEENTGLRFESRFESGNLGKVVKITDTYYQLYLRKDLYTQRHTQWYYFRISNTRSRTTYRLSIVNLCKEESLYNEGLRPLLYSTEDAKKRAVGWRRCGDNIAYYRNDSSSDEEKERHTLTFNVSFPHDRDTVYLAHCYPYTYTDLQEYLAKIAADPVKTRFTKLRLLCRTLAGNGVYYLTITAPSFDEEARRKRGVVITARVHPGETPSSWTMKGIIDYLTGDTSQAKELRERFVFKLVPMLNPDGVIVGNNRCSLSGKDLNRQYRTVMRESYPSVWHTKLMIRRLLEECGVAIYCDLHAHSRRHNIFAYGCESKRAGCYAKLAEQVFPLMLHKNAADKFSFENCKFHVEKGKEGTGRVVVWSMGVQHSYTLEASMAGSKIGSRAGTHFSVQDYEQIGRAFCETLLDFSDQDPVKDTLYKEKLRTKIIARLIKEGSSAEEPTNIDLTDYSSDEGDTSDSSVEKEEAESGWRYADRDFTASPEYLCVPPPSPTFLSTGSPQLTKRRVKKRLAAGGSYIDRRKLLGRRAVMDLPTTDPGSDFYDFNSAESADEEPRKQPVFPAESPCARLDGQSARSPAREAEEMEKPADCLILPEIVRPRSVSFGENLILCSEQRKTTKRSHCRRLARPLRNPSPVSLKSQDIQIKLSSLRRQIWTGVPLAEGNEARMDGFGRRPLSWGVSKFALAQCGAETLLRSCSRKLESLGKPKTRVDRSFPDPSPASRPEKQPHPGKPSRKKTSRLKWQRAVNLSSRIKETCAAKSSFLTIKADSLKLVAAPSPKRVPGPRKLDAGRKYRGSESVEKFRKPASQAPGKPGKPGKRGARGEREQTRYRMRFACSSSEDESAGSGKRKGGKKKQRKKRQQRKAKTPPAQGRKKRAFSGKEMRPA